MAFHAETDSPTDAADVTDRVAVTLPATDEAEPRLLEEIEGFVATLSSLENWKHDTLGDILTRCERGPPTGEGPLHEGVSGLSTERVVSLGSRLTSRCPVASQH